MIEDGLEIGEHLADDAFSAFLPAAWIAPVRHRSKSETPKISPEIRGDYERMFSDEYRHDTYRLAALAVELLSLRYDKAPM